MGETKNGPNDDGDNHEKSTAHELNLGRIALEIKPLADAQQSAEERGSPEIRSIANCGPM
jgi:hypothetical protein